MFDSKIMITPLGILDRFCRAKKGGGVSMKAFIISGRGIVGGIEPHGFYPFYCQQARAYFFPCKIKKKKMYFL
jgi:hypothetical protein